MGKDEAKDNLRKLGIEPMTEEDIEALRESYTRRGRLDAEAQDLLAELGIQPMDIEEIQAKYGRSYRSTRKLISRAREFGRANGIVIDRPVVEDGYLYRARWDWDETQTPNWNVMLTDLFSRTDHIRADIATYTANASAEGRRELAEHLGDIHDLFKVATRSITKARLSVGGE